MQNFESSFDVRWADIDANRHMRHSAYYDYAAHLRVQLLESIGMDVETLSRLQIGPVLFREEAIFHREIGMNERITVNIKLKRSRKDGSRWTFVHEFIKDNGKVAATVTVDGAWLDLAKRKLTALPEQFLDAIFNIPHCEDFAFENETGD